MFRKEENLFGGLHKIKISKSRSANYHLYYICKSTGGISNIIEEDGILKHVEQKDQLIKTNNYYDLYRVKFNDNPDKYSIDIETGKVCKPRVGEGYKIYQSNKLHLYARGIEYFKANKIIKILDAINKEIKTSF